MNQDQKNILLKLVHDAVDAVINHRKYTIPQADDPALNEKCGCFVTLKTKGRLRGCIGQFISDKPLIELVAEMAQASAIKDDRFLADRLGPDDIQDLDIEISVLSPLKRTTDPLQMRLGIHGVYIKKGPYSGCLLPQVAIETGWSKEEFLNFICVHKAGLHSNAWKDPDTQVYFFTADIIAD